MKMSKTLAINLMLGVAPALVGSAVFGQTAKPSTDTTLTLNYGVKKTLAAEFRSNVYHISDIEQEPAYVVLSYTGRQQDRAQLQISDDNNDGRFDRKDDYTFLVERVGPDGQKHMIQIMKMQGVHEAVENKGGADIIEQLLQGDTNEQTKANIYVVEKDQQKMFHQPYPAKTGKLKM